MIKLIDIMTKKVGSTADFVADEGCETGSANGSFLVVGTVSVDVVEVVVVVVGAAVSVIEKKKKNPSNQISNL